MVEEEKDMSERTWKWFKHGIQWDVKANGIAANGKSAKPTITVFTETKDRAEAVRVAITELQKYGYTNLTINKMMCYK